MSGAGPSLHPGDWPSRAVLKFPPNVLPSPVAPQWNGEATFANPFPVPEHIYQAALSYKVPLTVASVYAVTVTYVNWYNRQHGNTPWRIAKTRPFKAFVIFHNVFLALYSAVTCAAMIRCLKHSIPHSSEPNAVVATIDALCKIHGPRGLGDAVTYDTKTDTWSSLNSNILLGTTGTPDTTDVGRIWNEGLAFWGWWFYLSKFYEVLDTAIILAKGKRSTTLQKYHHAGAMLSMWAGMRFMSPPIWMFVLVNSGIHAMMYTYYTISAFHFRVPRIVKRTLTTLQIIQFIVGSTYAALHLFISYSVPVSIGYKITEKIASQANPSSISSAFASATDAAAASLPTASGAAVAFLRKLIYRAAGDEGLAENILIPGSHLPSHQQQYGAMESPSDSGSDHSFFHRIVERLVYRTEYQTVPCIETSGQAFAIYLNLIYLAPLTLLFMRFFFKSYLRQTSPNAKDQQKHNAAARAARDAFHGVERELEDLGENPGTGFTTPVKPSKDILRGRKTHANGDTKDNRYGSLSPANMKFVDDVNRQVRERLQEIDEDATASAKKAKQIAKEVVDKTETTREEVAEQVYKDIDHIKQEAYKANETSTAQSSKGDKKKIEGSWIKAEDHLDDAEVQKPEEEPEPKDLNNTLDKREGKGEF